MLCKKCCAIWNQAAKHARISHFGTQISATEMVKCRSAESNSSWQQHIYAAYISVNITQSQISFGESFSNKSQILLVTFQNRAR